jgi:hypothetical protein
MATIATRLESDGTLLVNGLLDEVTYNLASPTVVNQTTYSQQFEDAAWNKSGSFSIVDNSATAPDGSQTAAEATGIGSGVFPNIARNYAVTAGQVVTYSIYAKYVNQIYVNLVQEGYGSGYAININVQTGAVVGSPGANVTFLSTNAGDGWYRISTTYTIPAGQTAARPQFRIGLYDGSSYTGSKVLLWGAQFQFASAPTIYQPIAAADTLVDTNMRQRVDSSGNQYVADIFDEVTYNLTSPTIKNQLTFTQQINPTTWANNLNTITGNTVAAPDGSVTASRIQVNQASGYTAQLNLPVVNGQEHTFSLYVKSFDGSTGTWGINWFSGTHHRTTVPVTGDWVRQSITFTADASQINVYVSDNRSGLATINDGYVWGAQLELGSIPTIYQPIAAANTLVDTGMRQRVDSLGNQYVADIFDEFTGAPVVDSNLILWLDAGQSTSYAGTGNTWTDLSTNSLNGNLINTPTFDSQGWIVFDRTQSERVDFSDSASVDFTGTASYTLEAWVYPLSNYPTETYAGIFNHESNPGTGRDGWNMWLRGNAAQNTTMTFATERFALGSQSAPGFNLDQSVVLNNWHHIVTTYDGTNIRMYRNGNLAGGPSASSLSITNTTVTMNIASRGTGSYFDGRISVAKIYNRALTADEVSQNFNALRHRYGI